MSKTSQNAWLVASAEMLPTLVFLSLWRGGFGLETAGWSGAASAALVLGAIGVTRPKFSPVVLGINIHLLLITPAIVGLYKLGFDEWAETLRHQAQTALFVVVALVGALLIGTTERGLIGTDTGPARIRFRYSLVILAAVTGAIPWAYFHAGDSLTSVALPLVILFALRGYLAARLEDKRGDGDQLVPALGGSNLNDPA
ncbi:hypothetical protein [Nisaea sediminum]|uniref:hypothetical protein n=1 Tax=Nisaea sediminum TaxID=2775867 RepID=UPI001866E27B|nr:hypothetical protein [Nisaea sediminum]